MGKNSKSDLVSVLTPIYRTHDESDFIEIGKKDENSEIIPENIMFSSESGRDGNFDSYKKVVPRLTFLRDALDYEVSVVDGKEESSKVLKILKTAHQPLKYIHNIMSETPKRSKDYLEPDMDLLWDGKVYNAEEDDNEKVEKGQYYFRVRSRLRLNDDY